MDRAGECFGSGSNSGHNTRQPGQYIDLTGSDYNSDVDVDVERDDLLVAEGSDSREPRHSLHNTSVLPDPERDNEGPPGYDSSGEGDQITLAEALASTGVSQDSEMRGNYGLSTSDAPPRYSEHSSPVRSTRNNIVRGEGSDNPRSVSNAALPGRGPEVSASPHSSAIAGRSRYYPYPSSSSRQNARSTMFRQRSRGSEHSGSDLATRRGLASAFISRRGSPLNTEDSNTPENSRNANEPVQAEVVVPRWQPDAEVTYCPICHSQFTWVNRKHHCRKCGRVVCNSCSPHRITIPHRYIVQPPSAMGNSSSQQNRARSGSITQASSSTSPDLVGGERVRLCNPCVPDPWIAPDQHAALSQINQSVDSRYQPPYHARSTSSAAGSATSGVPGRPPRNLYDHMGDAQRRPRQEGYRTSRNSSTPQLLISEPRSRSSTHTSAPPTPDDLHSIIPTMDPRSLASRPFLLQSSSNPHGTVQTLNERPLPRPPRLAEEDECPVCHRELPSSALPNSDDLRATHISSCIERSLSGSSTASTPAPPPPQASSSSSSAAVNIPILPSSSSSTANATPNLFSNSNPNPQAQGSSRTGQRTIRRSGVFPYRATEKDCIDDAECTICLEEYEPGVEMGRLECFCRFHLRCIREWFEGRPGMCPVHAQYDGYGF